MARQTVVRATLPDARDPEARVEETWTVLTHEVGGEWWSELLDGNRHPCVHHDEYGYDSVRKFYGDSAEESRAAALEALASLVRRRGGRVESAGETEER